MCRSSPDLKINLSAPIKDKVGLEDDVAETEKIKEANRDELIEAIKASAKKKPTSK